MRKDRVWDLVKSHYLPVECVGLAVTESLLCLVTALPKVYAVHRSMQRDFCTEGETLEHRRSIYSSSAQETMHDEEVSHLTAHPL